MGNFNIINFIFCLILLIIMIGLFSYIGKVSSAFDSYKEAIDTKLSSMQQTSTDAKSAYTGLKSKVNSEQNQIIDMWFASLPKETMDKFELWEKENKELIDCDKTFIDAEIVAEYGDMNTYNISKSRAIAFRFDKGVLLYEGDGTIHCYALPIITYTPKDVSCKAICNQCINDTCPINEVISNIDIKVEDEKKE